MATCYVSILYNDVSVIAVFCMILFIVLKKFTSDFAKALIISILIMFVLLLGLSVFFMSVYTGLC